MCDRRTATALLVAGTMFMEMLDATVITTALPAIARDFGAAAAHLSVGVSAYLVALTIFIPVSGWAADRFGARRIFMLAISIFTLASILCAASHNLGQFTLARILQGIGGAMMVPVGRLVVLRDMPKQRMVHAIAILTWPALVAPLLGPVLGGWIATHWSWHWIFLLNLPLGLIALVASWRLIPTLENHPMAFDTWGFILSGSGFGMFMAGIEACSRNDVSSQLSMMLLIAGILLLAVTTYYLRHCQNPLFNLDPLQIATFRISVIGGSVFRIAIASAPFLLPLMFQLGFGFSAVKAGTLLLWLFAGNLCMKTFTTWILNRYGFKKVLLVNGLLVSAGFAAMAMFTKATPEWLMTVVLFISGMNRSMHFTAINTLGFADVPNAKMRDANTLQAILVQMNIGTGIAVGALALAIAAMIHGSSSSVATAADFRVALWFICGLSMLAMIDFLTLPKDAGGTLLSRKTPV
ncbi:MFS transporter [Shewanella yunxiaonensis]|nr:MFS transporter [Shewanella yunxiaonensis]